MEAPAECEVVKTGTGRATVKGRATLPSRTRRSGARATRCRRVRVCKRRRHPCQGALPPGPLSPRRPVMRLCACPARFLRLTLCYSPDDLRDEGKDGVLKKKKQGERRKAVAKRAVREGQPEQIKPRHRKKKRKRGRRRTQGRWRLLRKRAPRTVNEKRRTEREEAVMRPPRRRSASHGSHLAYALSLSIRGCHTAFRTAASPRPGSESRHHY